MIKTKLLLFSLLLILNSAWGQEKINQTEKLFVISKVWGFLKYYHPEITQGKYNWDQELFKLISQTKKSETKEDLSIELLKWIDSLGKTPLREVGINKTDKKYFNQNFDLSWINDSSVFYKNHV